MPISLRKGLMETWTASEMVGLGVSPFLSIYSLGLDGMKQDSIKSAKEDFI